MYTAPAMIGALPALVSVDRFAEGTPQVLAASLQAASEAIPEWQAAIDRIDWLAPDARYYFLGPGCSLSSCHEPKDGSCSVGLMSESG